MGAISMLFGLFLTAMGLYFGFRLRFFCFLHPVRCLALLNGREKASRAASSGGKKEYSPAKALTVALAGTLGVGNITGVAAALCLGGAGALFWMWMSALLTMLIKYAEVVLAVRHRETVSEPDGTVTLRGGPMRYLRPVPGGRLLVPVFCALCVTASFLQGNLIQTNAAAGCLLSVFGLPRLWTGISLSVCAALLVFGGRKRISAFTEAMIPAMTGLYLLTGLAVIIRSAALLPEVFGTIIGCAFSAKAAAGGGVLWLAALQNGCAKGVFSHEAGCGTSPISHAGAETDSPVRQGLLGIAEVAADTLVLCTVTGLVLLLSGVIPAEGLAAETDFVPLIVRAFSVWYGRAAGPVLACSMVFYAFATLVCWSFYGTEALRTFSVSPRVKNAYLVLFSVCTLLGVFVKSTDLWKLSDMMTAAMTMLNTLGAAYLLPEVKKETEYALSGNQARRSDTETDGTAHEIR